MPIHPSPLRGQRIAIVGDMPTQEEEFCGQPFSDQAGQELTRILSQAGIARKDCYLTYVFKERPRDGNGSPVEDLFEICTPRRDSDAADHPPLALGKYLPATQVAQIEGLHRELELLAPHVVVLLGSVPSWAVLRRASFLSVRGTVCPLPTGKAIPTFSHREVMRSWSQRPVMIVDLMKARRQAAFPEVRRPAREIWINPDVWDLYQWAHWHLPGAEVLSYDIETRHGQITEIGFSTAPTNGLVVPFVDTSAPAFSYWRTPAEEVQAWKFVRAMLQSNLTKLAQNGLYDLQWLYRKAKLQVRGPFEDTMILHHAMQPEMQKGLGFLGSIYTEEPAWKLMRKRSGDELEKADE